MKDKNVAALFALFFGIFGIHRFYLGQVGRGILYLMFFWFFGITAIIGLIDAIIFFSMDNDEFDYKYNRNYLNPDYRRFNTDFDRRERRFRQETEYRQEQRRRREEQIAKRKAVRSTPKRKVILIKPVALPNLRSLITMPPLRISKKHSQLIQKILPYILIWLALIPLLKKLKMLFFI